MSANNSNNNAHYYYDQNNSLVEIASTTTTTTGTMMEVAAAGDMGEEEVPPEHLFSDYIEITYLGAVISAGLALNFCVLRMLLREKRLLDRGGRQKVSVGIRRIELVFFCGANKSTPCN